MHTALWVLTIYMGAVGVATLAANSMQNSPTLDTIAALPSPGSLMGSTGVTAGALDLGAAAAVYFFVLR